MKAERENIMFRGLLADSGSMRVGNGRGTPRDPGRAKFVIAIDPNEWKQQQALQFGATHAFGDPVKAKEVLIDLTYGQLADGADHHVGEMDNEVVKAAVDMTGKAGTIVITGVGYYDMILPGGILIGYHRRMQGSLFGGATPRWAPGSS